MVILIDLIQPDKRPTYLSSLAQNLLESIWLVLRKNWTPNKYYINHLQKKHTDSAYDLKFGFTSFYKGILKISTVVHIVLARQIITKIQSNIGSDHKEIVKAFPKLQRVIMDLNTRKKASYNLFDFTLEPNGINTTENSNHHIHVPPRQFAKILAQKLTYSESLCYMLIEQFTLKQQQQCQDKNKHKAVKVYKDLGLIQIQNQRFKQFYRKEKNGQSVFQNPKIIGNKKHQVVRSLRFDQNIPINQILLEKMNQNPYKGSYSNVYYIQHIAEVFNTIQWRRAPVFQNPGNIPDLNKKNIQKVIVVKKVPTNNLLRRRDAELSLINQNYFLRSILGNSTSSYICNFYINLDLKPAILQPIYSDFHHKNACDIFFGRFTFTMLDILNFIQQLVRALISQYLEKRILHRDIKFANLLLHQGVIQIIDNGSVYPFDQLTIHQAILQHKRNLDSTLRTTYRIKDIEFIKSGRLIKKYHYFTNFQRLNSRHRTFDVYSVGRMLKDMMQIYQSQFLPKWMEISVSWYRLIERMIEKDFQSRIQMEDVLKQINEIRTKIYGNKQDDKNQTKQSPNLSFKPQRPK